MSLDLLALQGADPAERALRTPEDATAFLDEFEESMSRLIDTIEQETALVRAGKLFDATDVVSRKNDQLGRYLQTRTRLKREFATISTLLPDRLERMRADHVVAIEKIRANLGALAIAREVAEGIVRNVSAAVGRQAAPRTYGRNAAMPGVQAQNVARGLSIDRRM
jgi:hypothetical protein